MTLEEAIPLFKRWPHLVFYSEQLGNKWVITATDLYGANVQHVGSFPNHIELTRLVFELRRHRDMMAKLAGGV